MSNVVGPVVKPVRSLLSTGHGRIVLAGLVVGLLYFPLWLQDLVVRSVSGSTGLVLISSAALLGMAPLWRSRRQLSRVVAPEADRYVGHLLVMGAIALYPFFRAELWSQALVWLFVLVGIALTLLGCYVFCVLSADGFFDAADGLHAPRGNCSGGVAVFGATVLAGECDGGGECEGVAVGGSACGGGRGAIYYDAVWGGGGGLAV